MGRERETRPLLSSDDGAPKYLPNAIISEEQISSLTTSAATFLFTERQSNVEQEASRRGHVLSSERLRSPKQSHGHDESRMRRHRNEQRGGWGGSSYLIRSESDKTSSWKTTQTKDNSETSASATCSKQPNPKGHTSNVRPSATRGGKATLRWPRKSLSGAGVPPGRQSLNPTRVNESLLKRRPPPPQTQNR